MGHRRIGGAGGGLAAVGVMVALGVLGGGAAVTSTGSLAGPDAGSSASENIGVRTAESRKSGDSVEAWRRMGVRELKKVVKQDLECVSASQGQVRESFLRTPCTSLDHMLLTVDDGEGNSAIVSVVWVGFRTTRDMSAFKSVMDRQGSGDINPLAAPLPDLADIRFSGLNYDSEPTGKGITIAETEQATGTVAPDLLGALASIAPQFPQP